MKRAALKLATIVLALVCLTIVSLCAMSYSDATTVVVGWQGTSDGVWSPFDGVIFVNGAVVLFSGRRQGPHLGPFCCAGRAGLRGRQYVHLADFGDPLWWRPGRVAGTGLGIGGREGWLYAGYSIPSALVAAVSLVPVSILLAKRALRVRRRVKGMCAYCGYDLRATPDRCPECGAVRGRASRRSM